MVSAISIVGFVILTWWVVMKIGMWVLKHRTK